MRRKNKHFCLWRSGASQFETALVNLTVNARDAMDGNGKLVIRVEAVEQIPPIRTHPAKAGAFVAMSISDTGSGIPVERLEQIFEPFFTTKAWVRALAWACPRQAVRR